MRYRSFRAGAEDAKGKMNKYLRFLFCLFTKKLFLNDIMVKNSKMKGGYK